MVPHRGVAAEKLEKKGMHTAEMLDKSLNNYVLFNVEPEHDVLNGAKLVNHLKSADFVVNDLKTINMAVVRSIQSQDPL